MKTAKGMEKTAAAAACNVTFSFDAEISVKIVKQYVMQLLSREELGAVSILSLKKEKSLPSLDFGISLRRLLGWQ